MRTMNKMSLLTGAALGLAVFLHPGLVLAQANPPASQASQSQGQQGQQVPGEKFIQDIGDKALGIIRDKSLSDSQHKDQYRALLKDSFDMPTIGKFVLGRAWNTATPQQQQQYMDLFQQLVVQIYGDRMNFYNGEGFHVTGFRPESDKDVVITSQITHPNGGQPTEIDWRVRQDNGKMAIIDVTVEGVSQSVTQRQEFASILNQNNGNIDALLGKMRQKIQQASAAPGATTTQ